MFSVPMPDHGRRRAPRRHHGGTADAGAGHRPEILGDIRSTFTPVRVISASGAGGSLGGA